jgi:diaminohydroxyphosphoribosylaminopyrimidine deaminase/5-amino-6-(5-phosphoribosylamino)uracil reductase
LRAWSDAIVVGAGTIVTDDPRLTVREPELAEAWQPMRVVVDSGGRLAPSASVFDGEAPTAIATTDRAPDARLRAWEAAGAEVLVLEADGSGGVSPTALVAALGKRDVQGVLLEGGATLAWSFVRDGAIDRIVQYIAPVIVGGVAAHGVVSGTGFAPIEHAQRVSYRRIDRVGPDLRVEADVHRDR